MTQFVILCPMAARTGGPEACFQLSDALLGQGFDATMWLIDDAELQMLRQAQSTGQNLQTTAYAVPPRTTGIDEYKGYRTRPFLGWQAGARYCFVLPEVYVDLIPFFRDTPVLLWWLSVDNALAPMARLNLNWLRAGNVAHGVQSAYADGFVRALGLEPQPLSDYTVVAADAVPPLATRPLTVSFNAGGKVIYDIDGIAADVRARVPEVETIRIAGLSRAQVYQAFRDSRVFVDLGSFPGKDRMAREALLLGANVIVGRAGSGAHAADFPYPNIYRMVPQSRAAIAERIAHMLLNPEAHAIQFEPARAAVRREREVFFQEVLCLFAQLQ